MNNRPDDGEAAPPRNRLTAVGDSQRRNNMNEKAKKADVMTRTGIIYCQKKAAAALKKEFGFAPARLKEIILQEADSMCFYIHFRVGEHYYTCRHGRIERTDDKGWAL
jgi:hypothetical protein